MRIGEEFDFSEISGFEWDDGNRDKNLLKHGVEWWEIEQIFFNEPLIVSADDSHSESETRHKALGKTDDGRRLFVSFTVRRGRVRPISARDMSKKERQIYEAATDI